MPTGWFSSQRGDHQCYSHTLQKVCYALCDEPDEEIHYPSIQQCTSSFGISERSGAIEIMNGILFFYFVKGHIPDDHNLYSRLCENLKFQGWDIINVELIIYYLENCRPAAWRCRWQFPLKHWYLSSTCHHIQFLYVVMINTFHQTVVVMKYIFGGMGAGDSDIVYWNWILFMFPVHMMDL